MKLNYKRLGEGRPLIVLHGLFGSLDNWMSLGKRWSADYEVWLLDQRNHGKSPHSDSFNYELMAEDLKEFIQQHQIDSPIILGHSMGGKTAMEFAVKHSELLSSLIVVDIAPVVYEAHHYDLVQAMKSLDLNGISRRKEADELLSQKVENFGVRQFLLKNLYHKEKDQLAWRFNLPVLEKELLPISEWPISQGEFNKPTLFVKGGNSHYILNEYLPKIESKFPNYQLEIVENAGHWVHAEATEIFYTKIKTFLQNN